MGLLILRRQVRRNAWTGHPILQNLLAAACLDEGGGPGIESLYNLALTPAAAAPIWASGAQGGGLLFNGTTNRTDLTVTPVFTKTFSVYVVGDRRTAGATQQLVNDNTGASPNEFYQLQFGSTNVVSFSVFDSVPSAHTATGATTFTTGPFDVGGTFDSIAKINKVYLNGSQDGTTTWGSGTPVTPTQIARLGANKAATPANFFSGVINLVLIWSRVLQPAEFSWLHSNWQEVVGFYNRRRLFISLASIPSLASWIGEFSRPQFPRFAAAQAAYAFSDPTFALTVIPPPPPPASQQDRPLPRQGPLLRPTFSDSLFWDQPIPPATWAGQQHRPFPSIPRAAQSLTDAPLFWDVAIPPAAWNQPPFPVPRRGPEINRGSAYADPTPTTILITPLPPIAAWDQPVPELWRPFRLEPAWMSSTIDLAFDWPVLPTPPTPPAPAPITLPVGAYAPVLDLSQDWKVWDDRSTLKLDTDFMVWDDRSTLLLDQNFQVWDRMENVTFTRTRGGQSGDLQSFRAKRRNLNAREKAASSGAYVGAELVWLVPAVLIQGPIKPGDLITDGDGAIYTVLETDLQALKSFWRCRAVNLSIAYDLQDLVDIQRASVVNDGAGTPVKLFPPDGGSTLYSGVFARVQPIEEEIRDERGFRGPAVKYDVIVSQSATGISTEDRVLWTAQGRYLEIRRIRNPERVDELPVLECELVP